MKQVRTIPIVVLGLAISIVALNVFAADSKNFDLAECIANLEAEAKAAEEPSADNAQNSLQSSVSRFDECIKRMKLQSTCTGECEGECKGECGGSGGEGSGSGAAQTDTSSENLSQSLSTLDLLLAGEQSQLESEQQQREQKAAAEQAQQTSSQEKIPNESSSDEVPVDDPEISENSTLTSEEEKRSVAAKHSGEQERYPLDPQDEDVVLKTIRAAAEAEEDPQMQADLWEEYYEYADKK